MFGFTFIQENDLQLKALKTNYIRVITKIGCYYSCDLIYSFCVELKISGGN